jgi:uncharacterized membrane protein YbhN (UPF0104 family)
VAGDAFVEGLSTVGSVGGLTAVGLWTIARWCLPFVTIRLWLAAFGIELPWFAPIVLLASLAFGTALPAATAFIGTYHYALTAGLSLLGVADSLAVSVAIVAHATATLPYMMIGFTVAAIEVARGRLVIGAPAAKNPDGRRDTGEDLRR